MKKFVIFFIIFTQNILFGQVKDSLREVFEKIHLGYKKQCSIDSLKAIEDSKTKTIYYINIPAPNGYDLLQKNELSEILKKYNIEFGGTWMGSDIAGTYSDNQCYNWIMTKKCRKKVWRRIFLRKNK